MSRRGEGMSENKELEEIGSGEMINQEAREKFRNFGLDIGDRIVVSGGGGHLNFRGVICNFATEQSTLDSTKILHLAFVDTGSGKLKEVILDTLQDGSVTIIKVSKKV